MRAVPLSASGLERTREHQDNPLSVGRTIVKKVQEGGTFLKA